MKKKQISLSTIKAAIGIVAVLTLVLIVGSMVPVSITISEDTINNEVTKKLPLVKTKEIKIPLTNKVFPVQATVEENTVNFENDTISTMTSGELMHKDRTIRFSTRTSGAKIVYDKSNYAFYYKPEIVDVNLNQEDLNAILDPLENKAREAVEPEEKKSFFGKMKDKFKKKDETTIEVGEDVKVKINNNLFSKYKEKAKAKAREVMDNGMRDNLEVKLRAFVETSIRNTLGKHPVYTLKDKGHDEKAKLFLHDVKIENGELVIDFSLANILSMILKFFVIVFVIIGLVFLLSRGVASNGGHLAMGAIEIITLDL